MAHPGHQSHKERPSPAGCAPHSSNSLSTSQRLGGNLVVQFRNSQKPSSSPPRRTTPSPEQQGLRRKMRRDCSTSWLPTLLFVLVSTACEQPPLSLSSCDPSGRTSPATVFLPSMSNLIYLSIVSVLAKRLLWPAHCGTTYIFGPLIPARMLTCKEAPVS